MNTESVPIGNGGAEFTAPRSPFLTAAQILCDLAHRPRPIAGVTAEFKFEVGDYDVAKPV